CNLDCTYCYYLDKEQLYTDAASFQMPDDILEEYICQHIKSYPEKEIRFSWHGGEPTILELDYFKNITAIQRKHQPSDQQIINGVQTNGILLDDEWCRFFSEERFSVGISIDGPREMHDKYRMTRGGRSSFDKVMQGYSFLQQYNITNDILCVVNDYNVKHPLEVYDYFKHINARYISFLPLVERQQDSKNGVSSSSVTSEDFGNFLCKIFDEWKNKDIGIIKVQIFEEAARTAFGQEHSLCIFSETCGDIPVVEFNGDFYSCDHYVTSDYCIGNIMRNHLAELIESPEQREFGQAKLNTLPSYCMDCEVRDMCNGECPKNRFINTPDNEQGLNYLCAGYKQFFNHCRPFVNEIASVWRSSSPDQQKSVEQNLRMRPVIKTGRNAPCPCGSGKKFKHCCL
ncbi:anaerobic sulfatase maturase, partial [candidate division KSB1 bacterium]